MNVRFVEGMILHSYHLDHRFLCHVVLERDNSVGDEAVDEIYHRDVDILDGEGRPWEVEHHNHTVKGQVMILV